MLRLFSDIHRPAKDVDGILKKNGTEGKTEKRLGIVDDGPETLEVGGEMPVNTL